MEISQLVVDGVTVDIKDASVSQQISDAMADMPTGANIVYLTTAEFQALAVKDENTLYCVTDDEEEIIDGSGVAF